MLLVLAVVAALFFVPSPWGPLLVIGAAIVEVAEVWFWIWWTRRRKPVSGAEALVGAVALATTPLDPDGRVRVAGELWQASCDLGADVGDEVIVTALRGLTLVVEPSYGLPGDG